MTWLMICVGSARRSSQQLLNRVRRVEHEHHNVGPDNGEGPTVLPRLTLWRSPP